MSGARAIEIMVSASQATMSKLRDRKYGRALRRAAIPIGLITIAGLVSIGHAVLGQAYYRLERLRLQQAAWQAARMGAEYLPADRSRAVGGAIASVAREGIQPDEVVFIRILPNGRTLEIELRHEIPWFTSICFFGVPSRRVVVTAAYSARDLEPSPLNLGSIRVLTERQTDPNEPNLIAVSGFSTR
jgi:hypothetical protein